MERAVFLHNQPQGSMSLLNLRNTLRALFQMDLMPLRPRASWELDDMEYSTNALAQAEWTGTGVTVTRSTTKQEGNYALQAVIDATGNRTLTKSETLNLLGFLTIKVWERVNVASSAFQFFLSDGVNESYWDITSNGTLDTWQQDTLTLASPDSNNGSDCLLGAITSFGFRGLDADKTYIFDTISAQVGMTVVVSGPDQCYFHKHIWLTSEPDDFVERAVSPISAPAANPRIDILYLKNDGTLDWVTGNETASPVAKWGSLPANSFPICTIYCKNTMVKIVDYENKDANPNEGYIYEDVRPFLSVGFARVMENKTSDPTSPLTGQIWFRTDV